MSPLRLLVVSASLSAGGAERFVSILLRHLDRALFEPHLCLLRDDVTYPLPSDISVTVLHKRHPYHIPRSIVRLRRLVRHLRPHVVLGNMMATDWLVAAALQGLHPRPPWVARFAAPPKLGASGVDRWAAPWLRPLLRGAEHWVANSRELADEVERWAPGDHPPVTTILNPVDLIAMDAQASAPLERGWPGARPHLLWVGRLEREKRPDVLLEAFSWVRSRVGGTLCVLGEGSLATRSRVTAARLGISEHVRFMGFDPNPYRWMARADLLLMTSDSEGLPNALLEAQGLGIAAVSTDCPTGPGEIIQDGVTGRLVPPGDPAALAQATADLLEDEERRKAMGRAGRSRIRSIYDPKTIARHWERLLYGVYAPPQPDRRGRMHDPCAG